MIVEITDGVSDRYRGSLFYDLAKSAVIRLAVAQAEDLRPHGVTVVALTPGFLRSEAMLEHFGVDEGTGGPGSTRTRTARSETPRYIGRAVAPSPPTPHKHQRTGTATATWELAKAYGFVDVDGTQPDWGQRARDLGVSP